MLRQSYDCKITVFFSIESKIKTQNYFLYNRTKT